MFPTIVARATARRTPWLPSVPGQGRSASGWFRPRHRPPIRRAQTGAQCRRSQAEDGEGKRTGNGLQRLGRLGRGFDVGDTGTMQRRRGGYDDGKGHNVRECHPHIGIEPNTLEGIGSLPWPPLRCGTALMSSASCEACQKNRYADGGPEDGDHHGPEFCG
jgi:hypothetical protein